MNNEQELSHCDNSSSAYRNVENLVADITDRALLNGSAQRKQAFTANLVDSYRNAPTPNYAIGYSFKQLGIGTHDDADKILNFDQYVQGRMDNEIILTPNISSSESSDESNELDEKELEEKNKKNPFYGMQRMSMESSFSKSPMTKQQTEADPEAVETIMLQQKSLVKNYLNIFYFIIKFKFLLKKFISIRNIFTLQQHHFELINDKSFGNQMVKKKKNTSLQFKILAFIKLIWGKYTQIPVIDPSHLIVVGQEILSFAFILSQFFFLPIKASFSTGLTNEYLILVLEHMPPYYFFGEMVFNINKGYYHEGIAIVDRIPVFQNYIKTKFIVDLITAGILYAGDSSSFYTLIFLVRIPQLQEIFEKIDEHFQLSQKFPIAFQLFQLLYQIILVAHLCGCGFHFVGVHSDDQNNWITKNKLNTESVLERYICSIYFAIIAMITVGFGDVVPVNMYERIYVILQTCFSCGIFAFAINTIGNIVKEKQQQTHELKVNKNSVLSYMRDRNISKQNQNKVISFCELSLKQQTFYLDLNHKVIRFLEYSHKNQNDIPQKGKEIIQNMGKSVRDGVYSEFFNRVINQMPLFQHNFTEKFKLEIQSHLNETVYGPGDCIITQGKASKNVYFIVTGEVQQMIKMKESQQQQQLLLQVLKSVNYLHSKLRYQKGDSFDEECFISNLPCQYEYISKTATQVAFVQKDVFEEVIQAYKHDYELYCMLSHEIRLEGKYTLQSKGCQSCKNKFHNAINCPLLHYEVNHDLFLKRYICDKPQKREEFARKRRHTNRGNFKTMHNQLRLLRLRLPKTYNHHNQPQELFSAESNELNKLLEFEDEIFITCAPKITYSQTEEDIVFIHDEEDMEILQEMYDEIENTEDFSVNELTTLRSKSKEDIKPPERRNALYMYRMQNEDALQNQIQEQLEESVEGINNEQNDHKDKILNFAFSSDFSSYFPKAEDILNKKHVNIRFSNTQMDGSKITNSQSQLKSKSLTNLTHEQQEQNQEEDRESNTHINTQGTLREINNQKIIENQQNRFTVSPEQLQNILKNEILMSQNLHLSQQQQAELEDENYQSQRGSQVNNSNAHSSIPNIDDSLKKLPSNQMVIAQISSLYDEQPNSGKYHSDKLITLQSGQSPLSLSPKRQNEADINMKGVNKLSEKLQQKQIAKSKVRTSQVNSNSQKTQNVQQNNSSQNATQMLQHLKTFTPTPVVHVQNVQSKKKNTLIHSSSAQNIQLGNNVQHIQVNPKQSRISIHLNEPTPLQNQNLSINNISHSQIRELSSYSRRTVNSAISSNKIPSSQNPMQNNQGIQQLISSQLSNTQINSALNNNNNQLQTFGRQNSNFSVSNPSRQKKHQTFITNRVRTNTGTIIKSQQDHQNLNQNQLPKQQFSMDDIRQSTVHEKQLMVLDFDCMKIFQFFFTHNNYDQVIEQFKLKQQKQKKLFNKKSGKIGRKPKRLGGTIYQNKLINRRRKSQQRNRRKQDQDDNSPNKSQNRSSFNHQVEDSINEKSQNEEVTNQS